MMSNLSAPTDALRCDVLVVGGGPAGSTVSVLLREKGFDVLLAEKDRHPRFHIGESLLPRNIPLLRRLGVLDRLREIGVVKRGADFSAPGDEGYSLFDFSHALAADEPTAFQVKRAEFDHMLISNAAAKGVAVLEETRVSDVRIDDEKVEAQLVGRDGTHRVEARFLVDASGRDTFLSRRFGLKRHNRKHGSMAVFGHFENVPRRDGEHAGNISIYWFDQGWFWMIPLRGDIMSVGMVCWPSYMKTRRGSTEELFWQTVALVPDLARRMANAAATAPLSYTGNFSYSSTRMGGRRHLLVGDAYAFIDPVFSSGVCLAMQGAEYAAEAVAGCLRDPAREARYRRRYERMVRRGLRRFSWFIYRFTSPAMRYLFRNPSDRFRLRSAVISVLSGDVYGRTRLWPYLFVFKTIYYAATLVFWKESKAYRHRLQGLREGTDISAAQ